jgi:hypothetical protein
MRFLCDRMLVRLGRWLRAAGHDTAIAAAEEADGALIARARAEARTLLTCDRRLKREGAPNDPWVMLLATGAPDAAARELAARLAVDWQAAPFTRCMLDNAVLRPADAAEAARVPDGVPDGPVMACPACGRLYWPGSHLRRMRRRLADWQGARTGPAAGAV